MFFSGKLGHTMYKRSAKEYSLLAITFFTCVSILPFILIRFAQQDWKTATVDLIIALGMASIFSYVYTTRKVDIPSYILACFAVASVVTIIYMKGASHLFWVYPAVIAGHYLFPLRTLIIFSILLMVPLSLSMYQQVDTVLFVTFIVTFAITNVFAFIFAQNVNRQQQALIKKEKFSHLRNQTLELIVSSKYLPDILNSIVISAELEYTNMMCSILLLDNSGNHLLHGAAPSLPDFYNDAIDGIEIGDGVGACGTAAFFGKRVIIEDVSTHPYCTPWLDLQTRAGLGSCWAEPILNSVGKVLGTFAIYHKYKYTPSNRELELIEQFAHLASIAIEKEQANQLIWQQANFDELTGLCNRNMMKEHLKQAIKTANRNKNKVAITLLDLDNFKDVNDRLGHDIGDALLKETAKRIKNCIREVDTVARLGGDEFVIILTDLTEAGDVERVAKTILEQLSLPYHLQDEVIYSSVSAGITFYPDDGTNTDELFKNADQAMYQAMYRAKSQGRNNCCYFTMCMREKVLKRMQLIQDLRNAIKNEEFIIVYQPIVNLRTGLIYKAEALIRWQHPSKGMISPLDFIPLAEETGLIIGISDWMFKKILPLVSKWREIYHSDFQISINTSPIQYQADTGNIKKWVEQLQQDTQISKGIAFEITENLMMENKNELTEILLAIQSAGISISIDDFGTGYSSLSYLQDYQTDYLKIDMSFVQKLSQKSKDKALCEAIIVMAKKLNIKVIAEGIETVEQEQLLRDMGCDYGQGYLFSKPIVADEFEVFLADEFDTLKQNRAFML